MEVVITVQSGPLKLIILVWVGFGFPGWGYGAAV